MTQETPDGQEPSNAEEVEPDALVREATATTVARLETFIESLDQTKGSLNHLIANPGSPSRLHLEALNLLRVLIDQGSITSHVIAGAANEEPLRLSIPRLAEAMGISVNTLRSRLPSISQGVEKVTDDPFDSK